jgi:hypothetical protein
MSDHRTLASRLREAIDNPHMAENQSERFKRLLSDAADALTQQAKRPITVSLVRALRHMPAIPETATSRFEHDMTKWWKGLAAPAINRAFDCGVSAKDTANFEVMSYDKEIGMWVEAIPEPFYWGLFPWIWKRLTGWRDEYGRKAQLLNPFEIFWED